MSNDNTESISDKLRRWADTRKHSLPFEAALREFEIKETLGWNDLREVFRKIADEIDREKREITELYARQSWMNPADAIAKLATGEIEWPELKAAIDRYYLPRPLFDDGEPAQFGDMFVRDFGRDAKIDSLSYTKGNSDYVNVNGYERHDFAHWLKRPKPQVLDADGVPIVVGDKVWLLPGKHCETFPLYGYKDGVEYTVTENESASYKESGRICITGGDCIYGYPMPEQVTHRKPDTQERIDEDALKNSFKYWGCMGIVCNDCPSLVDGKKPRERYGVNWCSDAMLFDLLRRQRELDGMDA